MPNEKVVILIPHWIQEALSRNQLPLSACLELEKIRPILSLNDIVTFVSLQHNDYFKRVIGLDNLYSMLVDVLAAGVPNTNNELKRFCYDQIWPMSHDEYFHAELETRLFDPASRNNRYKDPFIIYDLTPEVCGVVIYPGCFVDGASKELQKEVLEGVIETLYVYLTFHEVAKTPFFKQYLKVLA